MGEVLTAEITTAKFPCIRCGEYVYIYRGKKRIRFKIDEVTEPTEDQLLGVEGTHNVGSPWNKSLADIARLLHAKVINSKGYSDKWYSWAVSKQSSVRMRERESHGNNKLERRSVGTWEESLSKMISSLRQKRARTKMDKWDKWSEGLSTNQARRMRRKMNAQAD